MTAEKNSYKLTYFNVRALAEPIRWIFHYAGIPFEDERIPWDYPSWFQNLKNDFQRSVGQMPVLTVNGKELCQSSAISRYLADEFDLLGNTSWERARGDEVISLIFDLFDAWRKNVFERDPARRAANKPVIDQRFPLYYAKLNQLLEETDGDFLNGTKLSHADFWIASFVNIWNNPLNGIRPILPPDIPPLEDDWIYIGLLDDYPALKKHQEKVLGIPQIKKWISERPKTIC